MFARLVEPTGKPGKRDEIIAILTNELLPLMRKQEGFVDAVGLISDTAPHEGTTLTFWKTKNEAERFYRSPEFTKIMDRISLLVESMNIRTFNVEISTFHNIAMGKAA